jgi:hypothetical protein
MTRITEEELRQYFPEQYEQKNQVSLLPTAFTSKEKHKQHWFQKHRYEYIETESWTYEEIIADWKRNGIISDPVNGPYADPGKVLIKAALGGDPNAGWGYWFVLESDYQHRDIYGYVIHHQDELAQEC